MVSLSSRIGPAERLSTEDGATSQRRGRVAHRRGPRTRWADAAVRGRLLRACRISSWRASTGRSASRSWSARSTWRGRCRTRSPRTGCTTRSCSRARAASARPARRASWPRRCLREGPDRRAVRRVRPLPGDRGRPFGRRHRDRRAPRTPRSRRRKSILEGVRYLPARARRKVYIIDEVHMLSAQAFNALLKTLEEPPPHVVFMFATTEVHKIPGHHPVALPALRLQADPDGAAGRAPGRHPAAPRRSRRRRTRCA